MALIKCPECEKEVSETAASCPNCGFSIEKFINEKNRDEKKKEQDELKKAQEEKYNAKEYGKEATGIAAYLIALIICGTLIVVLSRIAVLNNATLAKTVLCVFAILFVATSINFLIGPKIKCAKCGKNNKISVDVCKKCSNKMESVAITKRKIVEKSEYKKKLVVRRYILAVMCVLLMIVLGITVSKASRLKKERDLEKQYVEYANEYVDSVNEFSEIVDHNANVLANAYNKMPMDDKTKISQRVEIFELEMNNWEYDYSIPDSTKLVNFCKENEYDMDIEIKNVINECPRVYSYMKSVEDYLEYMDACHQPTEKYKVIQEIIKFTQNYY